MPMRGIHELKTIIGCSCLSGCRCRLREEGAVDPRAAEAAAAGGKLRPPPGRQPHRRRMVVSQAALRQKTSADSSRIGKISIFSSEKQALAERFRKKAALLSRIDLAETKKTDDQTFTAAVPMKMKALKEKQYYIAMLYEYGKRRSALGAILPIKTMIPPRPVSDLKVSQENKVILLKWSKPAKDADDNPLPPILGYNVYRKIKVGKEETASRMLNRKPLQREVFEDSDSSQDGEYHLYGHGAPGGKDRKRFFQSGDDRHPRHVSSRHSRKPGHVYRSRSCVPELGAGQGCRPFPLPGVSQGLRRRRVPIAGRP